MTIEISDLTQKNPGEFQCIESYLFIRRCDDYTERVALTSPRLDSNRDSLGGMRPISILYSNISNEEGFSTGHWTNAAIPYLTTDGQEAQLYLIKRNGFLEIANMDGEYSQHISAVFEILKEALQEFESKYSLSRINLQNIIATFERAGE